MAKCDKNLMQGRFYLCEAGRGVGRTFLELMFIHDFCLPPRKAFKVVFDETTSRSDRLSGGRVRIMAMEVSGLGCTSRRKD